MTPILKCYFLGPSHSLLLSTDIVVGKQVQSTLLKNRDQPLEKVALGVGSEVALKQRLAKKESRTSVALISNHSYGPRNHHCKIRQVVMSR
jgi:hypothetical protein